MMLSEELIGVGTDLMSMVVVFLSVALLQGAMDPRIDRRPLTEEKSGPESAVKDLTAANALNDRGEEYRKKGEFDQAISKYNAAIKLAPDFAWPYNNRGLAWASKGEFDRALEDYSEALRLDPKYTYPYNNRGLIRSAKGEYELAIKDYSEAIRLDPNYSYPYSNRGIVWQAKGEYAKAIEDFAESIRLDPKFPVPYNSIAWLRATCPDPRFRAGKEGIEFATRACELTEWKSYSEIDTLAAAYAEAGEFTTAVIWELTALEKAPEKDKKSATERLQLFQANKPYREQTKE